MDLQENFPVKEDDKNENSVKFEASPERNQTFGDDEKLFSHSPK